MAKLAYKTKRFRDDAKIVIARTNQILEEYAQMGYDMTLRQVYYQHVARGWLANKQTEYNRLGGILNDARLAGYIDWNLMVDRTRNMVKNPHWDTPADIINASMKSYGNDLWADQDYYVEGWVEKEALAGVLERSCSALDMPWFSCRGYVSQSEMWGASRRFLRAFSNDKKVVILHMGDHDPSGIDMTRDVEERLFLFLAIDHWRNKMAGSGTNIEASIEYVRDNFEVRRLALNMDQVEQYDPPPNPAKLTDSRSGAYVADHGYESWELDALPPDVLGNLIEAEVDDLRDEDRWSAAVARQERDRDLLREVSDRWAEVVEMLS